MFMKHDGECVNFSVLAGPSSKQGLEGRGASLITSLHAHLAYSKRFQNWSNVSTGSCTSCLT